MKLDKRDNYKAIGIMTGSSLDGIDIVYCSFKYNAQLQTWSYTILKTGYYPLEDAWRKRLANLVRKNAINYIKTHTFFGHYLADFINDFIDKNEIRDAIDFVASHGQTIFHQPENKLTSQIGCAYAIAALIELPVIFNFRNQDVALGGQGTPLAPTGDKYLFNKYRFCINLGGISNISTELENGNMLGFDISACNLVLNHFAQKENQAFDKDGAIARSGTVHNELLAALNNGWYFKKDYPKSLGGGWVSTIFLPIFNRYNISHADKLRTMVEHIAQSIANSIQLIKQKEQLKAGKANEVLLTGGGALNKFLVERIAHYLDEAAIVPSNDVINYKEAIIIAFCGVLRVREEPNMLSSVTGSSRDNCGGAIALY